MEQKNFAFTIVDISGYTHFIKYHKLSHIHAEEVIFDLLEEVRSELRQEYYEDFGSVAVRVFYPLN
jgi:hypothetical protein